MIINKVSVGLEERRKCRPGCGSTVPRQRPRDPSAARGIRSWLDAEVKPYNIRTTVISSGALATELPNSMTEPDVAEKVRKAY